jgi:predicted metal-dependent hydrolase
MRHTLDHLTRSVEKLPWIWKQKAKFEAQERQTKRMYVSGETHYFFGRRYRLEVLYENGPAQVELRENTKIILRVRPLSTVAKREEVVMEWYRKELRNVADKMISKWQGKIGVRVKSWGIKKMKTRWGTCNQKAGRIWINLELAKKPISCVEYIVVHELLHLIEKKHNERFVALITKYLPKWRNEKEELNRFALSHEEWNY